MKRIIQKAETKLKKCPTCGCVFEYDYEDIEYMKGLTCLNQGRAIVRCPSCEERIDEKSGWAVNELGHMK